MDWSTVVSYCTPMDGFHFQYVWAQMGYISNDNVDWTPVIVYFILDKRGLVGNGVRLLADTLWNTTLVAVAALACGNADTFMYVNRYTAIPDHLLLDICGAGRYTPEFVRFLTCRGYPFRANFYAKYCRTMNPGTRSYLESLIGLGAILEHALRVGDDVLAESLIPRIPDARELVYTALVTASIKNPRRYAGLIDKKQAMQSVESSPPDVYSYVVQALT